MAKFRKTVAIEAFQWDGTRQGCRDLYSALNISRDDPRVHYRGDGFSMFLTIRTLEGDMRVSKNDWVICGAKGELYPCKPDIFAETYEPEGLPAGGEQGLA